ncbi:MULTISPECIES: Hsp70 family protein [unclassified Nocardia]|uniref:Hsp70 family protein n=1 Tax=unclassified Nocardia TaxID=2637762 RepID=UPI00278C1C67|nr:MULTISPECIES: Hsp70 family protein [unclassified Nocardia]
MSSVLGVSVGVSAVRVARPLAEADAYSRAGFQQAEPFHDGYRGAPQTFDTQDIPVGEQRVEELVADAVGAVLAADPSITATAIAYRDEQHARGIRAELARRQLINYELIPDVVAALEFLEYSGDIQGFGTVAVYDLGASGLSITVVDTASRQIHHTERTSDISGDYLDSLIREQQIASGRIAHPPDAAGLAAMDELCRKAKEQLSTSTAVALPSPEGLVLLSQENFEALIMLAVESSARMARDVILRSEQPVEAVAVIGGCARIPLVARVLRRWLGIPVVVADGPETAAVRGAAMLARPVRQRQPLAQPQPDFDEPAPRPRSQSTHTWLSGTEPGERSRRRREISVAGVAVGALVVVSAIGVTLGWRPTAFEPDSQSRDSSTTAETTSTAPRTTSAPAPTTEATNESVAAPPPRYNPTTTSEEPPPPSANTITVIPGLPPIVVPTIPPLFPPAPAGQ